MTPDPIGLNLRRGRIEGLRWGAGPAVLAIHGWLDNAASFWRLAPLLSGYSVYAIDLPGHGQSEWKPEGYRFVDAVFDICEIIDELGFRKVHLLGHSMGAGLAPLAVVAYKERIERMICFEGLGPLTEAPNQLPQRLQQYRLSSSKSSTLATTRNSIEAFVEVRAKVTPGVSKENIKPMVERGVRQTEEGFQWSTDPKLRMPSPYRFTEEQVKSILGQVDCPTLAIWADEGFDVDHDARVLREQQIRNIEVVRVKGQHHVHLSDPQTVAQKILNFLNKSVR